MHSTRSMAQACGSASRTTAAGIGRVITGLSASTRTRSISRSISGSRLSGRYGETPRAHVLADIMHNRTAKPYRTLVIKERLCGSPAAAGGNGQCQRDAGSSRLCHPCHGRLRRAMCRLCTEKFVTQGREFESPRARECYQSLTSAGTENLKGLRQPRAAGRSRIPRRRSCDAAALLRAGLARSVYALTARDLVGDVRGRATTKRRYETAKWS